MFKIMMTSFMCAVGVAALVAPATLGAQDASQAAAPPDFSGVYYRTQAPLGGPGGDGEDGGPAAGLPKLAPEYLAKREVMRKSRAGGSSEFDPAAQCIPQGMPSMMGMIYGMEIQHTRDRITMYGELNDSYRRIYLDGRKPSQKVLDDPTYAGYSTGHWEGDTLVVDTVALRPDSLIGGFSPHSDQMTVKERIRFTAPRVLEDRITVSDPKALLEPHESVLAYRKAFPPYDELREFACAEGLANAK
jgi:hypothetical protein